VPSNPLQLAGCKLSVVDPSHVPLPFDLMLDIEERGDAARGLLRFDAGVLAPETAQGLADAYPLVIEALVRLPQLPVGVMRSVVAGVLRGAARTALDQAAARRYDRVQALRGHSWAERER
jgi:hypothetical protein